ncbi:MAG: glucose-6-phosphate isomerase [Candidatus Altiarchaeota archaeon]|nr:glucose-6-phosphate isomerase [Candidatus Altiarchaeota archaeon]
MEPLKFGNRIIEPDTRRLGDMKDLFCDSGSINDPLDTPLYFMYRDLSLGIKDKEAMARAGLRYDITIIPPKTLGKEYVKTAGHTHPKVPGTDLSYTELYEVLEGEAHYLLQKMEGMTVTGVVLVEAGKGDKIVVPPNYGHVTINPSRKTLKMANIVSTNFTSSYGFYREKKGGAYFELTDGFHKNRNYVNLPELTKTRAKKITGLGIEKSEEIYSLVRKDIKRLEFLNKPQLYGWLQDIYGKDNI